MLYHLIVYVPRSDAQSLKEALFDAGAGRYERYDRCAWQTEGRGEFRPLEGSNPAIGKWNETEQVDEVKIEMMCVAESIKKVLEALKNAHPYEEPAYGVMEMKTVEDF